MNEDTYKKEDEELDTELQKLISEVQQDENREQQQHNLKQDEQEQRQKIDILDLPPRKETHSTNKGRTHVKFSKPMLRLLLVIIILLSIIAGIYFISR